MYRPSSFPIPTTLAWALPTLPRTPRARNRYRNRDVQNSSGSRDDTAAACDTVLPTPITRPSVRAGATPTLCENSDSGEPACAITICLLPDGQIALDGDDVTLRIRPCARETLYLIALHQHGISRERLCETLLPDEDPERQPLMLNTRLKLLRDALRTILAAPSAPILLRGSAGYRCDPTLITVDTWQFKAAFDQAAHATDDQLRAYARHQALMIYRGVLLEEAAYPWAHAHRVELQHKAVTALLWLAAYRERQDPEHAISILEQAIDTFAPYEEEPYRQLMRLHSALGRVEAVSRTYRLLTDRLTSIGVKPDFHSQKLFNTLVNAK